MVRLSDIGIGDSKTLSIRCDHLFVSAVDRATTSAFTNLQDNLTRHMNLSTHIGDNPCEAATPPAIAGALARPTMLKVRGRVLRTAQTTGSGYARVAMLYLYTECVSLGELRGAPIERKAPTGHQTRPVLRVAYQEDTCPADPMMDKWPL